jgi:hypothetical protein
LMPVLPCWFDKEATLTVKLRRSTELIKRR